MLHPNKHHRRSVRLPHFDYGSAGAYFVTVCAAQKRPVFGQIEQREMRPNAYGMIAAEEWQRLAAIRPEIAIDEFVVMPNHFHAIFWITREPNVGVRLASPKFLFHKPGDASIAPTGTAPKSLGAVIGGFKSGVTCKINRYRAERNLPPVKVWQRSFHDRIIRDEKELIAIRKYIIENPLHWDTDKYHVGEACLAQITAPKISTTKPSGFLPDCTPAR